METEISIQDLILNLKAAGFSEEQTSEYLALWNAGEMNGQLRLLTAKRRSLLDHIHQKEKQIGCLDYLVYQMKQTASRNGGIAYANHSKSDL